MSTSTPAWVGLALAVVLMAALVARIALLHVKAGGEGNLQPVEEPTPQAPAVLASQGVQRSALAEAAAVRGITIRPLSNEDRRRAAYDVLRSQISDTSLFPYLPVRDAILAGRRIQDTHETMLGALDKDKELLGAAYFGPEWTAVLENQVFAGIPAELSLAAYERVTILHGIATAPDARSRGVGRLLLRAVEEYALRMGVLAVAGVTGPESQEFYERCGYTMLGHEVALVINPTARSDEPQRFISLPIEGSSQWFAKTLTDAAVVGGCPAVHEGPPQIFWLKASPLTSVG